MAENIKHQGVIENITGSHVRVRIIQTSACATCSIKGHCTSADTKEKLIDVYISNASEYKVGEEVWVLGTLSMGIQAVLLAFVLPLVLLVVTLFVLMKILGDELLAVGGVVVCLFLYYLLLHLLFKGIWKGKLSFSIQR